MRTGEHLAVATFAAALQPGATKQPVAATAVMTSKVAPASGVAGVDIETLERELQSEFAFMSFVFNGRAPTALQASDWEAGVRWVLQELQAWQPHPLGELDTLRGLLVIATALDVKGAGLKASATGLTNGALPSGLVKVISQAGVHIMGERDERIQRLTTEADAAAAAGDFRSIGWTFQHLAVVAHSDLSAATDLLWASRPADLATLLAGQTSVLRQYAICGVLGDDAPVFAHQVPSATFKYLAICALEEAYRARRTTHNWGQVLEQLLLDVAATPHWAGYMQTFFAHPQNDVLPLQGLADALVSCQPARWSAFIEALSLSYSKRFAQPVADIAAYVLAKVGPGAAKAMWDAARARWAAWDYGKGEADFFMASPQACALDYPVAMYYATLSAAQRAAEEACLLEGVENLEMTWFATASQLITERNRLLSHLRLVQHGSALATGGAAPLPAAVAAVDWYTEVRYRFYDVQRS